MSLQINKKVSDLFDKIIEDPSFEKFNLDKSNLFLRYIDTGEYIIDSEYKLVQFPVIIYDSKNSKSFLAYQRGVSSR